MSLKQQLKLFLHPYAFILKEGRDYSVNSMSYDLLMLHINNEVIKSPKNFINKEMLQQSELEVLKTALPQTLARIRAADAN